MHFSLLLLFLALASAQQATFIYYTSDDAANSGTPLVLDAAQRFGVPVTFFANGYYVKPGNWGPAVQVDENLVSFQRMVNEGHTMGDHSYDHMLHNSPTGIPIAFDTYQSLHDLDYFGQRNADAFWNALNQTEELWSKMQTLIRIVRLPHTNTWRVNMTNGHQDIHQSCFECTLPISSGLMGVEIADVLHYQGSQVFGWDIEWPSHWDLGLLDTAANMLDKVKNMTSETITGEPNKIILLNHDHGFRNTTNDPQAELEQFFQEAQEAGFIFRSLETYHLD